MSGYIGNDGSQLAGGVNPSGGIQGLSVDNSGKLNVNASVSSGPTNITQINGAAVSASNGLPISGNNGGSPIVLIADSSGRLILAPNASFNLAQVLGAALSASNPVFVSQAQNGAVLSATNPEVNISNIQQFILNGQSFNATTGKVTAAANMAAQFWVPATSTKNVLIWSVRTTYSNANQTQVLQLLSAQDTNITAGTNDSANFTNLKAGGGAAASGATLFHNGGVATATGTVLDFMDTPFTQSIELLSSGMFILIPAGTAQGIAVYAVTTATGFWSFTVRWVEF